MAGQGVGPIVDRAKAAKWPGELPPLRSVANSCWSVCRLAALRADTLRGAQDGPYQAQQPQL